MSELGEVNGRSLSAFQLCSQSYQSSYREKYTVASTGKVVDTSTAVSLITNYFICFKINKKRLAEKAAPALQPSFKFEQHDSGTFSCNFALPLFIPQSSRFFCSPQVKSKKLAKGLVCVAAVAQLHRLGKVSDHLTVVESITSDESTYSMEDHLASTDYLLEVTDRGEEAEGASDQAMDSERHISVKTVPDCLLSINNKYSQYTPNDSSKLLYLYCLAPVPSDSPSSSPNISFAHWSSAAAQMGIALQRAVPPEVTTCDIPLSLFKDVSMTFRLQLLGEKRCSAEEVRQMQRFHRAVAVIDGASDGELSNHTPHDSEWSQSSNGAWFLIYPAPVHAQCVAMMTERDSAAFLTHLGERADGACRLARNLTLARRDEFLPLSPLDIAGLSRKLQSSQCGGGGGGMMMSGTAPPNAYSGLVVMDQGLRLLLVPSEEVVSGGGERVSTVRLGDVMKVVSYPTYTASEGDVNGTVTVPLTYYTHLTTSNDALKPLLSHLANDSQHRMLLVHEINRSASPVSLLGFNNRKAERTPTHVVPELCSVMGDGMWYYFSQLVPSVVYRVQSLLLASEARDFLFSNSCNTNNYKLPSLPLLLSALTPKMCLEGIDSER
jgi:hypothetical protein